MPSSSLGGPNHGDSGSSSRPSSSSSGSADAGKSSSEFTSQEYGCASEDARQGGPLITDEPTGRDYASFASRSASSSQLLTSRITLSRAGIPSGNNA